MVHFCFLYVRCDALNSVMNSLNSPVSEAENGQRSSSFTRADHQRPALEGRMSQRRRGFARPYRLSPQNAAGHPVRVRHRQGGQAAGDLVPVKVADRWRFVEPKPEPNGIARSRISFPVWANMYGGLTIASPDEVFSKRQ